MIRILFLIFIFFASLLQAKTIGIFTCKVPGNAPWDQDSINSGITGSEEAVIYMSKELAQLGHQVIVFGDPPADSLYAKEGSNPLYVPADVQQNGVLDIAIAWRVPTFIKQLRARAHKVYFWPHDTCDWKLCNEEIESFDDVLWLSAWQRDQWISVNPGFAKFKNIFGNGVNLEQFEPVKARANPYSCIYGSNYGRGLEILLDIWPTVKKKFPKATLDIYYGWKHWGCLSFRTEQKMRAQVTSLAKLGVVEHGLVGHKELHEAYARASFWTYPCILPETFCITAIKAQLAGAVPVILMGSALKETVRGGYSCNTREQYLQILLRAMANVDKITLEDRKKLGAFVAQEYTWKSIAKKWNERFENNTICLNMIVKNESKVICRCLESIKDIIDEWVIVDTGSTDGTQQLIKDFLKDKPGTLYERPWVNFEHNRNEALDLAKGRCDYVLLIDADEVLQFSEPFDKKSLEKDTYLCVIQEPKTRCHRTLLLKDRVGFRWIGVLHERITGPAGYTQAVYPNLVNVSNTLDGCRSQNPNKYRDDAIVLERELEKDPDNMYYLYFLGQSYVLCGESMKAISAFERCSKVCKNPEIIWFCRYLTVRLHEIIKECPERLIEEYSKSYMDRPSRAEPLYYLARQAFMNKNFILAYSVSKFAHTLVLPIQDTNSHLEPWVYDYGVLCMLADSALNLGKTQEAQEYYLELLQKESLSPSLREQITSILSQMQSQQVVAASS